MDPANSGFKEVVIEATVIRADGTREELGQISYWHKNPLRRLAHKLKEKRNGDVRR